MPRPWMPMYWGDFLRDTKHLSKWQRDSYMMLIGHYWTQGSLPDDDIQLARITDCTLDEWLADKKVVKAFFYDGWKHKRVEAEMRRTDARIAKAREHGQKGGQMTAFNRAKESWQQQRRK